MYPYQINRRSSPSIGCRGCLIIIVGIIFLIQWVIGRIKNYFSAPTDTSVPTHQIANIPTSTPLSKIQIPGTFNEANSYHVYNPITWMELISFIENDRTNFNYYDPVNYVCLDFAVDLVANASKKNIEAWVVGVDFYNDEYGHAFTGFKTTDRGDVFIEPQTDIPYLKPIIGKPLCDGWTATNCLGIVKSIDYVQCDHDHYCSSFIP